MNEYNHKEAFCLMIYMCDICGTREVIWNSRDGVTPFGTACQSCGGSYTHHFFGSDECHPEQRLNKYQKYWRDGTEKEARDILHRRYKTFSEQGHDFFGVSEQEFVDNVMNDGHEFQEGWPILDICLESIDDPR